MSSEHTTFISALLLDGQGGASELSVSQVQQWNRDQGLLWLHIDCQSELGRTWLNEESDIDPVLVDALLDEDTRPRVTHNNHQSLVFLRGVNLAEDAEPEDMVSLRILFSPDRIITTRKRRLLSVQDMISALLAGRGPVNSADFLAQVSSLLLLRIDKVIDQLEEQQTELEERLIRYNSSSEQPLLMNLRQRCIHLRRFLAPQREAFIKLSMERRIWLDDESRPLLQECADRLTRFVEELDMIRERAIVAQEQMTSYVAEQLNQRMYVMSLIAAIFLPLGFVTGLLGVNVGGIPGGQNPFAFLVVCLGLIVCAMAILFIFKLKKWF